MNPVLGFQRLFRNLEEDGLTAGERAQLLETVSTLSESERAEVDRWLESHYPGSFEIGSTGALLPLPDSATLRAMARRIVQNGFARVPDRPGETRHVLNTRLQTQDWTDVRATPTGGRTEPRWDGSALVVIAFEGTGAFEPRLDPGIAALTHTLRAAGYDTGALQPARWIEGALREETGTEPRWSGLAHGPRSALAQTPELEAQSQWFSFPSEELEFLASPDAYRDTSPHALAGEILRSSRGTSSGINSARAAVSAILAQAENRGVEPPRFVVVSHSSGGRSAVKFLEFTRDEADFALAFTVDPVREAHEAVAEAAGELAREGWERGLSWAQRNIGLSPSAVQEATVRSRSQPESLYRVGRIPWVNYYQRADTDGLKMDPRFGIHGSPIHRAENIEVCALGASAHGEITYQPVVLQRFIGELRRLLP